MPKLPALDCALLAVSVDVDVPEGELTSLRGESAVTRLADSLSARGVAATWCTVAANLEPLADALASARGGQVTAHLLTDGCLPLAESGVAGCRGPLDKATTDALLKRGITAVCDLSTQQQTAQLRPVESLRYGLWSFPVSLTTASTNGWSAKVFDRIRSSAAIKEAAAGRAILHACIPFADYLNDPRGGEMAVDDLFGRLAKLRAAGQFEIAALSDLPGRLTPSREKTTGRSILRAA